METSKRKAAGREPRAARTNYTTNHSDNSAYAQRWRILAALRIAPVTTLEARRRLDVLHPAARVQELREARHDILTHWSTDYTSEGKPHRCARYVLIQEGGGA